MSIGSSSSLSSSFSPPSFESCLSIRALGPSLAQLSMLSRWEQERESESPAGGAAARAEEEQERRRRRKKATETLDGPKNSALSIPHPRATALLRLSPPIDPSKPLQLQRLTICGVALARARVARSSTALILLLLSLTMADGFFCFFLLFLFLFFQLSAKDGELQEGKEKKKKEREREDSLAGKLVGGGRARVGEHATRKRNGREL